MLLKSIYVSNTVSTAAHNFAFLVQRRYSYSQITSSHDAILALFITGSSGIIRWHYVDTEFPENLSIILISFVQKREERTGTHLLSSFARKESPRTLETQKPLTTLPAKIFVAHWSRLLRMTKRKSDVRVLRSSIFSYCKPVNVGDISVRHDIRDIFRIDSLLWLNLQCKNKKCTTRQSIYTI
jgi:hypothetical protein